MNAQPKGLNSSKHVLSGWAKHQDADGGNKVSPSPSYSSWKQRESGKGESNARIWSRRVGVHRAEANSKAAGAREIIEERRETKGVQLVNSGDVVQQEAEGAGRAHGRPRTRRGQTRCTVVLVAKLHPPGYRWVTSGRAAAVVTNVEFPAVWKTE